MSYFKTFSNILKLNVLKNKKKRSNKFLTVEVDFLQYFHFTQGLKVQVSEACG